MTLSARLSWPRAASTPPLPLVRLRRPYRRSRSSPAPSGPSRADATALGVAEYLVKPVERNRVARALDALGEVERILIVEDDPQMARLLAAMVRSLSSRYRVWTAQDGAEALTAIEVHQPDAMLLDLVMPGMDGHELLHRLRTTSTFPLGSVIVVSAGSPEDAPMTAEITRVTSGGGLPANAFLACLRATLDALHADGYAAPGVPATTAA